MRKLALLLPLLVSGCTTVEPTGGTPMPLINAAGQTIGTVRAWRTDGSITFDGHDVRGLSGGCNLVKSAASCEITCSALAEPKSLQLWPPGALTLMR